MEIAPENELIEIQLRSAPLMINVPISVIMGSHQRILLGLFTSASFFVH